MLKEVVRSDYFNRYPYEFFEENYLNKINGQNFSDLLMKIDRKTWLVDEDLLRADKMGMANGLEVRVPLLDKNLVEFSENIPFSQKINLSNAKIILKQAFSGRIPDYLLKQPKRGWFSPGAKWLRRPEVLSKAREVLLPNYYKPTKEMFDWRKIEEILENHISGKNII